MELAGLPKVLFWRRFYAKPFQVKQYLEFRGLYLKSALCAHIWCARKRSSHKIQDCGTDYIVRLLEKDSDFQ